MPPQPRLLPLPRRVDPRPLSSGDGPFHPGDEIAVIAVIAGVSQLVEIQGAGRTDDLPERVADAWLARIFPFSDLFCRQKLDRPVK